MSFIKLSPLYSQIFLHDAAAENWIEAPKGKVREVKIACFWR
ncbi:hypothetical protein Z948_1852 [Sulfitobacter donghicola DSW-25 = KCTC 12864 = JCM 14565]|nr:hypothetical protein Z948_1852 [Sulfitobacter donghicola DSW-25 = KCTC 12864 = JCM 14565]